MNTLKMCGAAIIASFAAMLLRELGRNSDVPVKLGAAVILLAAGAAITAPLVAWLGGNAGAALGGNFDIIIRAMAIALCVRLAADICRECGAAGVGAALEIAGRIEVLILALPILGEALETVGALAGI